MRIIVLHPFLDKMRGAERVLMEFVKMFDQIVIITPFYWEKNLPKVLRKTKIITLDKFLIRMMKSFSIFKMIMVTLFFLSFLKRIRDVIKEFDLVIFSVSYSTLASTYLKNKKLVFLHGIPLKDKTILRRQFRESNLFIKLFLMFLGKKEISSLKSVDLIIANSYYTKKLYEKKGIKVHKVV